MSAGVILVLASAAAPDDGRSDAARLRRALKYLWRHCGFRVCHLQPLPETAPTPALSSAALADVLEALEGRAVPAAEDEVGMIIARAKSAMAEDDRRTAALLDRLAEQSRLESSFSDSEGGDE